MADIKDKIRKLLALADGKANDNESQRALELAHKLMMEHGIEQSQLEGSKKQSAGASPLTQFDRDWQLTCASTAAVLYGVRCITRGSSGFYFVGRPDNNEMALLTTAYLIAQVESLYKQLLPKGLSQKERALWRRDFKRAASARVWYRVKDFIDVSASQSSGTALVIHKSQLNEEIDDYLTSVGANIGKSRRRAKEYRSPEATYAGVVAGDSVDFHKTVS